VREEVMECTKWGNRRNEVTGKFEKKGDDRDGRM